MSANTDLVTEFIHSWGDLDVDKMLDYFTDDAIYINIPIDPPNHGKAEIRAFIQGFVGDVEAMEFIIEHQAETADGLVLNERIDRFLVNGQWVDLPVMGIFEIENGKISKWRDYFDMEQFNRQMSMIGSGA